MSEENVEIVRQAFATYNRGDIEGALEHWTPDAVLDWSNSRGLDARIFRGRDEVREFMHRFIETFEEVRIELIDPVEVADGLVLAENLAYLQGRDGIEVEAHGAFLIGCEMVA